MKSVLILIALLSFSSQVVQAQQPQIISGKHYFWNNSVLYNQNTGKTSPTPDYGKSGMITFNQVSAGTYTFYLKVARDTVVGAASLANTDNSTTTLEGQTAGSGPIYFSMWKNGNSTVFCFLIPYIGDLLYCASLLP